MGADTLSKALPPTVKRWKHFVGALDLAPPLLRLATGVHYYKKLNRGGQKPLTEAGITNCLGARVMVNDLFSETAAYLPQLIK